MLRNEGKWYCVITTWHSCCCLVAKLCLTPVTPRDCSMPGLPVLHYLLGFAQTHVHWVGDAIQSSHPLSPCSSFALNLSHIRVFPVSQLFESSIGASASASVLPVSIQGWFPLELTGLILQSKGLSRGFFSIMVRKHQFFSVQPSYGPTLTSVRD